MNYEDTWSWPDIPVEPIDREEIATVYSFGHYDGPGTGLILWKGEYWYVTRFEGNPRDGRYWVIQLTPEQQQYAVKYGKTWREFFHPGMSWHADGSSRRGEPDGIYAIRPTPNYLTMTDEGREKFKELFPSRPEPDEDAKVVGYFDGWRM